jgi:ABC-type polysaccharide/polyol phosphate export systems, permease component
MSRSFVVRQSQILGALMMREMATRYGRRGLGFLWVVGEPLMFCFGVIIMWMFIRHHNGHGLAVAPFVMTGYMCLLLLRHSISFSISAVGSNLGLLYHRALGPLHFYVSRCILELAGATAAFIIVYLTLILFRQVDPPHDWLLLYFGWFLMWIMATGTGFIFSGLATRFEVMERVVPLLSYAMIPLSGVFFMVDWLPENVRERYLLVPYPNAIEMIRAGVFGEFVPTHFNVAYATVTAFLLLLVGLVLVKNAEGYIDVE